MSRRRLLGAGLAAGVSQVAGPFVLRSQAADLIKIGLADPLTGPYAGLGKNELVGCEFAVEQINANGGILGRQVELVAEDSSSGDASTAVQKARKLIDADKVDFVLGNVNSALTLAMAQVSNEKRILHVVPGAHTDAITGSSCRWNVSASAIRRGHWLTLSRAPSSKITAITGTISRRTTHTDTRSKQA